jgi:hypothetical protein
VSKDPYVPFTNGQILSKFPNANIKAWGFLKLSIRTHCKNNNRL